jgi:hypothetical protein
LIERAEVPFSWVVADEHYGMCQRRPEIPSTGLVKKGG